MTDNAFVPDNFSLERYCQRIGFTGSPAADLATLTELMRRQLFSVPFENLDVQAGKIVSLDPAHIAEKILDRQRGGYCYEVNGLFSMALHSLGIAHQFVFARPMFYPVRRPKTHMAIVAQIDGEQWLCDLGFGSYGIRQPLALSALDTEVQQDFDRFMLSRLGDSEYLLRALVDGEWKNQYSFDLYPAEWIDFTPANFLNSTHPDAIFVQKLLVIQHNPLGRDILLGDQLKTIARGVATAQTVTPEQRAAILAERFQLASTF